MNGSHVILWVLFWKLLCVAKFADEFSDISQYVNTARIVVVRWFGVGLAWTLPALNIYFLRLRLRVDRLLNLRLWIMEGLWRNALRRSIILHVCVCALVGCICDVWWRMSQVFFFLLCDSRTYKTAMNVLYTYGILNIICGRIEMGWLCRWETVVRVVRVNIFVLCANRHLVVLYTITLRTHARTWALSTVQYIYLYVSSILCDIILI